MGALIQRRDTTGELQIWIFRRSPEVRNPGEWEFPGGKVELGELPEAALIREIKEELSLEISVGPSLGEVPFEKSGREFMLTVYVCQLIGGELTFREHDSAEWVGPRSLDPRRLSAPDRPFIQRFLSLPQE